MFVFCGDFQWDMTILVWIFAKRFTKTVSLHISLLWQKLHLGSDYSLNKLLLKAFILIIRTSGYLVVCFTPLDTYASLRSQILVIVGEFCVPTIYSFFCSRVSALSSSFISIWNGFNIPGFLSFMGYFLFGAYILDAMQCFLRDFADPLCLCILWTCGLLHTCNFASFPLIYSQFLINKKFAFNYTTLFPFFLFNLTYWWYLEHFYVFQ